MTISLALPSVLALVNHAKECNDNDNDTEFD